MLFCTENVAQTGLTTLSKESVQCTWNIPKGQTVDTTVKPVQDLVLKNLSTQSLNLNQLNWQMIKNNTWTFPQL